MINGKELRRLVILIFLAAILCALAACSSKPSGTYTATGLLGIKSSVTFHGDTLDIQSPLGGRDWYKYEIRNDQTEIILTDAATSRSRIMSFKYIQDPDCVVLNGTAYYK